MLNLLSRLTSQKKPDQPAIRSAIEAAFDPRFYLETYRDVAEVGIDPLDHYIRYGAREGRDPSAEFSTSYYLAQNPDVRESGMNPLHHFVLHGRTEGRTTRGDAESEPVMDAWVEEVDELADLIAPHFDAGWYLARYPELDDGKTDPLHHYLLKGASEGRDPAPWFSTRYYLDTHADVRSAGVNPLVHYARAGRKEERLTRPPGGFRADALRRQESLAQQAARWRRDLSAIKPLTAENLARALWREGDIAPWMVLSLTHDDYAENTGGIQLAAQTEQAAFSQARIDYINLHPVQPLPTLAPEEGAENLLLTLRRNGHAIGSATVSTIALVFDRLAEKGIRFDLIVHALQGHAPEAVAILAEAARTNRNYLWIHDSFTICPGFTLMRNDVSFCGAPAADSPGCRICRYGAERLSHQPRVRALCEAVRFTAIAPSESARTLWSKRSDLDVEKVVVHSHCSLASAMDEGEMPADPDAPARIAFLGYPSLYKGWPAFQMLLDRDAARSDMQFHYFGSASPPDARVEVTSVSVTRDDREAMSVALHEAGIDVAVLWSLCPETFSFAAHEALAAGALIVTHADSGNIARLVKETGLGWVLPDEAALLGLVGSEEFTSRIAERRRKAGPRRVVAFSDLTADLLLREDRK